MNTVPDGAVRRRRAATPWIVLLLVAVLPAAGLFAAHRWSAEVAAAVSEEEDTVEAMAEPIVDPESIAPMMSTPVSTFRRMPTVLARDVNTELLSGELEQLAGAVNDRSCLAVSVDGQRVAERSADVAVIPASNQKLPVAGAALELLGPNFRYRTTVVADVEPVAGVVDGDLALVGGGDPLLSSEWYPTSNLELNPVTSPTSLDELADSVVAAGVTEVRGSVIGDGSRYDDEYAAPGWGPGVAGLEAGPYDALMVNDSRVLDDPQRAADPNEAAAREFTRLLDERGVTIGGDPAAGLAAPDGVEVASIESASMADVIAEMLGNSDNNTAEMLVKELGVLDGAVGTREAGLAAVREQLIEWDVDVEPIVLADGSGLSLDNRLTCDAILTVLERTGFTSAVGQGLPVAAQTGTLRDIFDDHPVAGRLRGKTGTLNNPPFNVDPPAVKALAGFLPAEEGGEIAYALVLNGPTISDQSEYRPLWSDLADALDSYPAGVAVADLGPR